MTAYYNEFDPYVAQWLRNLIAAGHIAPGDVDERSIRDVHADDVRGYDQCHFFAGIGGWSLALRLAGWPDDKPVWTGSCPCQSFSNAGQGRGFADERHLWPVWFDLIRERRPSIVFGEQVEGAVRHGWLDLVSANLEGEDYAFGAAVLGAHSVGAPNIRQRLWFVAKRLADAEGERWHRSIDTPWKAGRAGSEICGATGGMADADCKPGQQDPGRALENEDTHGRSGRDGVEEGCNHRFAGNGEDLRADPLGGFWRDADWLYCRDGKWRPVEPGLKPLVDGASARVGRLRAFGNAINPWVAADFVKDAQ